MMFPWKKGKLRLMAYFAKGRRLRMLWVLLTTIGAVFMSFLPPQIVRLTVDSVIDDVPMALPGFLPESWVAFLSSSETRDFLRENIWICAAAVIAIALITALFNFIRRFFAVDAAEYTAKRMRDSTYDYIQKLPYKWHVEIQTGDIIQRCTSDIETVRNFMANQMFEIIRILTLVIFALAVMFSMDIYLTLISLILIPLIVVSSIIYFNRISKRFQAADEEEGVLQATVQENLTGVRVVRAFGRESYEMERFNKRNDRFAYHWIKLMNLMAYYWGFGDAATGLQLMITTVAGTFYCIAGNMTVGTFLSFYTYSNMLIWPVRELGRLLSDLGRARISSGRILEIMQQEPEKDGNETEEKEISGDIVFDHVTFGYEEGTLVLKDVSFSIGQGQTLGILGGTGSGKSTISYLLTRLYDVPDGNGTILLDGIDIRKYQRECVRRQVGLVLQEPFLFSKTIRQNIAITHPDASVDEVRKVAKTAAVDDAIMQFDKGYDTIVGERGVTLSGGQKQRVAIARMLMQHGKIMIFDDSLSAVDAKTDSLIRHALEQSNDRGATRIIISHRITTLQQADKIIVMKEGRIVESGSHNELIALGGIYNEIAQLQGSIEEVQSIGSGDEKK